MYQDLSLTDRGQGQAPSTVSEARAAGESRQEEETPSSQGGEASTSHAEMAESAAQVARALERVEEDGTRDSYQIATLAMLRNLQLMQNDMMGRQKPSGQSHIHPAAPLPADPDAVWNSVTHELKVPKPFTLTPLGSDKGDLVYFKWRRQTLSDLASQQARDVIEKDIRADNTWEYAGWYKATDAVVYAALHKAVQKVPHLCSAVGTLEGKPHSSKKTWEVIRNHYIRVSNQTIMQLRTELHGMQLLSGESMDDLLGRFQAHGDKWEAYGMPPPFDLMVERVCNLLPWNFVQAIMPKFPPDSLILTWSWEEVCLYLKREDLERRTRSVPAADTELPLGWSFRYVNQGRVLVKGKEDKAHANLGQEGKGSPKGKSPGGSKGGERDPNRVVCCYFCKKVGHTLKDCWTVPEGWKAQQEDIDAANAAIAANKGKGKGKGKGGRKGKGKAQVSQVQIEEISPPASPAPESPPASPPVTDLVLRGQAPSA